MALYFSNVLGPFQGLQQNCADETTPYVNAYKGLTSCGDESSYCWWPYVQSHDGFSWWMWNKELTQWIKKSQLFIEWWWLWKKQIIQQSHQKQTHYVEVKMSLTEFVFHISPIGDILMHRQHFLLHYAFCFICKRLIENTCMDFNGVSLSTLDLTTLFLQQGKLHTDFFGLMSIH